MENTVTFLKSITFSQLTHHEKIEIKTKNRPMPKLDIKETANSRGKIYVRKFNPGIYDQCDWICGCEETKSLFCFPCLLFRGDSEWTTHGVSKLKNLHPKISKHERSRQHLNNVVSLSLLGKLNIRECLSAAHRRNELVKKIGLCFLKSLIAFYSVANLNYHYVVTTRPNLPQIQEYYLV